MSNDEEELELARELGATAGASTQKLTVYVPDKDRDGNEIGTQRAWVLQAARLLARIGGGATIMPPVEGVWYDEERDHLVWERPVLVYTFIHPERFVALLPELREFIHRLGRETRQGEVIMDFDGTLLRFTSYDEA